MNQTENGSGWRQDNWIDNTQSKCEEVKPADRISLEPSFEMDPFYRLKIGMKKRLPSTIRWVQVLRVDKWRLLGRREAGRSIV